jgi:hypothetical protein
MNKTEWVTIIIILLFFVLWAEGRNHEGGVGELGCGPASGWGGDDNFGSVQRCSNRLLVIRTPLRREPQSPRL